MLEMLNENIRRNKNHFITGFNNLLMHEFTGDHITVGKMQIQLTHDIHAIQRAMTTQIIIIFTYTFEAMYTTSQRVVSELALALNGFHDATPPWFGFQFPGANASNGWTLQNFFEEE